MEKVLAICIPLLIISSSIQAKSVDLDSKIIFKKSNENQKIFVNNLDQNQLTLLECEPSTDPLQSKCKITGVPEDESVFKSCSVTFHASYEEAKSLQVQSVYRLKEKLVAILVNRIPKPKDAIVPLEELVRVLSIEILDNCVPVKTIKSQISKDGTFSVFTKVVVYEDGLDVIEVNVSNNQVNYHNYDSNGNKIGEQPVLPEQVPAYTPYSRHIIFGTRHSHGIVFSSGYHYYPNGSIIEFANDRYKHVASHEHVLNDVDDGPYHTACDRHNEEEEFECVQYDVENKRQMFQANAKGSHSMKFGNVKNLHEGGFVVSICDSSKMTAYVMRPNRQTLVDYVDFPSAVVACRISSFDEKTGRVAVISDDGTTITRRQFILKNYAAQL